MEEESAGRRSNLDNVTPLLTKAWMIDVRRGSLSLSHNNTGAVLAVTRMRTNGGCWGVKRRWIGIFGGIFKSFRAR